MGSERTHVDKYLCTVCGHRHSNGWYCKHSIDAKDAEIERLKRAMDLRHKDAMKLVDLHTKLESENERLKAQLAASEEKRKVLGEEVNFIRHMFDATEEEGTLVWTNCDNDILEEYGQLKDATDAASAMEAP